MTEREHKKLGHQLFSKKQIAAEVIKWAIRQSPYSWPAGIEAALTDIYQSPLFDMDDGYGFFWMDPKEVVDRLLFIFTNSPAITSWNTRANGNKSEFGFVSRYDKPDPDNDFIDLHALALNVRLGLHKENMERP